MALALRHDAASVPRCQPDPCQEVPKLAKQQRAAHVPLLGFYVLGEIALSLARVLSLLARLAQGDLCCR